MKKIISVLVLVAVTFTITNFSSSVGKSSITDNSQNSKRDLIGSV